MSIWLLFVYAMSLFAAVVGLTDTSHFAPFALPVFVLTGLIFLSGVMLRGIRRPVV